MVIYYYGADHAWTKQDISSLNRRNMAYLLALAKDRRITKVYNVIRCTRQLVLKRSLQKKSNHPKIHNVYIAPILPERGVLNKVARPINRALLKILYPKIFGVSIAERTLAWCYWPQGFKDFEFMGLEMNMIFDTDHNIFDEPNSILEKRQERKELLFRAGRKAKYILSGSRSMLQWYQENGFSNTKILMNGVYEERLNLEILDKESFNYTVTYCGTLSKWIKTDWLFKIIQEHPQWTFNFIGANYQTDLGSKLEKFSNVKLMGFLEPKEVDHILKQSDICFGLYQKSPTLDGNSMKLYDYLAQNIPVVVNDYHSNLEEDFNDLLNIASSYDQFSILLEHPKPIDPIALKQFLTSSSWNQRANKILNEIIT